jgi:hypothetical protein
MTGYNSVAGANRNRLSVGAEVGNRAFAANQALDRSQLALGQDFANQEYGSMATNNARRFNVNDEYNRMGISQDANANAQELALQGNYANERNRTLEALHRERLGVIEGRTDLGPDVGMMAGFLSQPRGGGTPIASTGRRRSGRSGRSIGSAFSGMEGWTGSNFDGYVPGNRRRASSYDPVSVY